MEVIEFPRTRSNCVLGLCTYKYMYTCTCIDSKRELYLEEKQYLQQGQYVLYKKMSVQEKNKTGTRLFHMVKIFTLRTCHALVHHVLDEAALKQPECGLVDNSVNIMHFTTKMCLWKVLQKLIFIVLRISLLTFPRPWTRNILFFTMKPWACDLPSLSISFL